MARTDKKLSPLNTLSLKMLAVLKDEFIASKRKFSDLQNGYTGIKLPELQAALSAETDISEVEFEISVRALEGHGLAKVSGDLVDTPDIPGFAILSLVTKREHIFLTEAGYQKENPPTSSSRISSSIIITGGTFHQPQIASGQYVHQHQKTDIDNDGDAVKYLSGLLASSGVAVSPIIQADLSQMVLDARAGRPSPTLFQKVFGGCGEVVKNTASGILMDIVKQIFS